VAGSANIDLFLNVTTTELRRQMDLNYFGQVEMAHAILREWLSPDAPIEAEARHLILTATTACFLGVPGYSIYGPAKAGIRYVADCLSHEIALYPQNVKLHVVFPGNMLSPGFERENVNKPEITKIIEETDPRQEPDDAAAQAIQGLENGQYFCTLNWLGAIMRWGGLGSSMRVDWIADTLGAVGMSLGWPVYLFDLRRTIKNYAKKNGHPATLRKQNA
jgi:3-dehydrosphinganine reductase